MSTLTSRLSLISNTVSDPFTHSDFANNWSILDNALTITGGTLSGTLILSSATAMPATPSTSAQAAPFSFIRQPATVTVAASNSRRKTADFYSPGSGTDETVINTAIAAVAASANGYGRVLLSEGTFQTQGEIAWDNDYITLEGQAWGYATQIVPAATISTPRRATIVAGSTVNVQKPVIRNLSVAGTVLSYDAVNPPIAGSGHNILVNGRAPLLENLWAQNAELHSILLSSIPVPTVGQSTTIQQFMAGTSTASATSSGNTLTGTFSTTAIPVGMQVTGPGISGTSTLTVTANTGTSITLSGNVSTNQSSAVTFQFTQTVFASEAVQVGTTGSPMPAISGSVYAMITPATGTDPYPEWVQLTAANDGTHYQMVRGWNGSPTKPHSAGDTLQVVAFPTTVNDHILSNIYCRYPGIDGLFVDIPITDGVFDTVKVQGAESIATPRGRYGIFNRAGEAQYIKCHPYFNQSHGLYHNVGTATSLGPFQVIGGEYETNNGDGIHVEYGPRGTRIEGVAAFANSGADIRHNRSLNPIISDNALSSTSGSPKISLTTVTDADVHGNSISNGSSSSGQGGIYAFNCTNGKIQGNTVTNLNVAAQASIALYGTTSYFDVSGNNVDQGIIEAGSADYNNIHDNTLLAGEVTYTTPVGITLSGAHSAKYQNNGPGTSAAVASSSSPVTEQLVVTANTTAFNQQRLICNGSGNLTITTPPSVAGYWFELVNTTQYPVTVSASSGTVNGGATVTFGQSARYICDGTNWRPLFLTAARSNIVTATATHTTANGETTIVTSGTFTDTLPTPVVNGDCIVQNIGTGVVTVTTPSGTLYSASGATGNQTLAQGVGYHYQSDGTSWYAVEAPAAALASPAFTGTPTAPTNSTATDSSTQIATDAFVQAAIAAGISTTAISFWTNGVPSSGLGVNGDTAVDYTTGNGYVKSAGSWGSVAFSVAAGTNAGSARSNLQLPALTPVAAVAISNISTTAPGATLDGYTLASGDSILLTGQSTPSQNGVWVWNGAAAALTRPSEFVSASLVNGRSAWVKFGNVFANSEWLLDAPTAGLTIDTTAQTWTKVSKFPTGLDVRDFGAQCDGGASATGTLNISTAVITDTSPSSVAPIAGQLATWVGLGAAVGGGISAVTLSSIGATNPIITTTSAHGLSTGQQISISGATGATWLNSGLWDIIVITTTTFMIRFNWPATGQTGALAAWVSGGTIKPTQVLTGYVSNPVNSSGTLTYTMVTTQGGSTAITIPASTATTGHYYYGSDDTTAVQAAFTKAATLAWTQNPPAVTGPGVSMVSSLITVTGPVMASGVSIDESRDSNSNNMPQAGFIIRPHGTFANALTSPVVQFGSTSAAVAYTSDGGGSHYFTVDAANICQAAIRVVALGTHHFRSLACNGIQTAWDSGGQSTEWLDCHAAQSQCGDGLRCSINVYVNPGSSTGNQGNAHDNQWKGGVLRLARNAYHGMANNDIWFGAGAHPYGAGTPLSTDILIEDIDVNSTSLVMGTTNTSPTVTCAGITAAMLGQPVLGSGIPASTYVGTVTAGTSFLLSSSSSSQVNVNATATATILGVVGHCAAVTVSTINGPILDAVDGIQIRLNSKNSAGGIYATTITGVQAYVGTGTFPTNTYPMCQLDAQTGKITELLLSDTSIYGTSSQTYLSVIDLIGSLGRITVGPGSGRYVNGHYSGTAARSVIVDEIGPFGLYNGSAALLSRNFGQSTITGNGATTAFNIAHGLSTTPAAGAIQLVQSSSSSPVGFTAPAITATATNIVLTYSAAPTSGSITYNWRAAI